MAVFDFSALPGLGTSRETAEKAFLWGKHEQAIFRSAVIDKNCTDLNNTPTTTLRVGLLMSQISTNKWTAYNPVASDGSEVVQGVLANSVNMVDLSGSVNDRATVVVVAGPVKGEQLIRNVALSPTIEPQARALMDDNFIFDDLLQGNSNPWTRCVPKTASYTVTLAESGTEFTNTGAGGSITFTLPALLDANSKTQAKGVIYRFTSTAAQAVVVTHSGSDVVIFYNDAAHTIFTSNGNVGITQEVRVDDTGTKWLLTVTGSTQTVVSAS